METLRKIMRWQFGLEFLTTLASVLLPHLIRIFSSADDGDIPVTKLWVDSMFLAATAVFGMAWWTLQRRRPSGRTWAIAGSVVNLMFWAPLLITFPRILSHLGTLPWVHSSIGVVGLVAFSGQGARAIPSEDGPPKAHIAGDGTNEAVNKVAGFFPTLGGVAVLGWWIYWVGSKKIPSRHYGMPETLFHIFLAGLLTAALLELTSTATGLALRMKARAFAIGPLQWRNRDGRWVFQFVPARFLSLGGITSFASRTTEYSPWRNVCMLAVVPMAALMTGTAALWIANASDGDAAVQGGGLLALCGAFCWLTSAIILIPFRKRYSHSPGAVLCQLWMGGPWADLQRVQFEVASSLTTAMRPREYDFKAIERARGVVVQGMQAMLLVIYAYCYFLDGGKMDEAGEALKEAESIYPECAADVSAELQTIFVFGEAYVRRDPVAARTWWMKLQAKNPTQFNVDYWRALSALRWIEGDLKGANEDWKKCESEAKGLPGAGVYEFDRHCCKLLRTAIDESTSS